MTVGLSPDGKSVVIRGNKAQLDKIIQCCRDAVLYGQGVGRFIQEEDGEEMTLKIFKEWHKF